MGIDDCRKIVVLVVETFVTALMLPLKPASRIARPAGILTTLPTPELDR